MMALFYSKDDKFRLMDVTEPSPLAVYVPLPSECHYQSWESDCIDEKPRFPTRKYVLMCTDQNWPGMSYYEEL